WPVKIYAHIVNHYLRQWDYTSSQRPDYFIANSEETKKRIKKFYRRDADVIYPPVDIPPRVIQTPSTRGKNPETDDKFYITLSRLTHAKHIDVLIQAANKSGFKLKIIGSGRDEAFLKSIAGPTVEFLSHIPDEQFETVFKNAKAFLFASVDEEFGIAPVEAMGYGVPVIAFASGGLKEIVQDGKNGYLYDELTDRALIQTINKFEKLSKEQSESMRKEARKSAEKYSFEVFKKKITSFINLYSRPPALRQHK
ncbi:MAG: glycosyltransferase, partial [Candidatus Roizmanbacteria bacterium]|nr:glycosyltransferase [Candidatus Roizmanbacteria bacterium]